jgi:hypothetical protein
VEIERANACGKTMTAQQQAGSAVLLDINASARRSLSVNPALCCSPARLCRRMTRRATPATDPGLSLGELSALVAIGGWPAQQERPRRSRAGEHQPGGRSAA